MKQKTIFSRTQKRSEHLGRYFEAVLLLVVKRYLGQAIRDLSLTFYKVIHSCQIKRGSRDSVHFDSNFFIFKDGNKKPKQTGQLFIVDLYFRVNFHLSKDLLCNPRASVIWLHRWSSCFMSFELFYDGASKLLNHMVFSSS